MLSALELGKRYWYSPICKPYDASFPSPDLTFIHPTSPRAHVALVHHSPSRHRSCPSSPAALLIFSCTCRPSPSHQSNVFSPGTITAVCRRACTQLTTWNTWPPNPPAPSSSSFGNPFHLSCLHAIHLHLDREGRSGVLPPSDFYK